MCRRVLSFVEEVEDGHFLAAVWIPPPPCFLLSLPPPLGHLQAAVPPVLRGSLSGALTGAVGRRGCSPAGSARWQAGRGAGGLASQSGRRAEGCASPAGGGWWPRARLPLLENPFHGKGGRRWDAPGLLMQPIKGIALCLLYSFFFFWCANSGLFQTPANSVVHISQLLHCKFNNTFLGKKNNVIFHRW